MCLLHLSSFYSIYFDNIFYAIMWLWLCNYAFYIMLVFSNIIYILYKIIEVRMAE